MPKKIKIGFLTNSSGAHVGAYLNALRDTDACNAVVLADPDGKWANEARKVLATKKNIRVLETGGMPDPGAPGLVVRSIAG